MDKLENFRNTLSRSLGIFGLFWSSIIPFLGIPIYLIGIIVAFKIRNTKDGFFNVLFNIICLIISILYTIFIILNNTK